MINTHGAAGTAASCNPMVILNRLFTWGMAFRGKARMPKIIFRHIDSRIGMARILSPQAGI